MMPVVKKIFNKHRCYKRIAWKFDCEYLKHTGDDCEHCDLIYQIFYDTDETRPLVGRIPRKVNNICATGRDMSFYFLTDVETQFMLVGNKINYRTSEYQLSSQDVALIMMAYQPAPNQFFIRSLRTMNSLPISTKMPAANNFLAKFLLYWDCKYLSSLDFSSEEVRAFVLEDNYLDGGLPPLKGDVIFRDKIIKANDGVIPLKYSVLKTLSLYHQSFGGRVINGTWYSYKMYSADKLYPTKLPQLIQKFSREPYYTDRIKRVISDNLVDTLKLLYSPYFLDTQKFHGKYKFSPDNLERFKQSVPWNDHASAGPNIGPTYTKVDKTGSIPYRYHISRIGTKGEQFEGAFKTIQDLFNKARESGEYQLPAALSSLSCKHEVYDAWGENDAELIRMHTKCREFFIMDALNTLVTAIMHSVRHGLETGGSVQIGRTWWNGGAYEYAKYMRYDDPEMEWAEGDFRALDQTVKAIMTSLYTSEGLRYYDPKLHTRMEWSLLQYITKWVGITGAVKIVRIVADVWRIFLGMVASGHYDTSMVDSWVVNFFFCLFLVITIRKSDKANELNNKLAEGKFPITIYGDDHIYGYPKKFRSIVGVHNWKAFIKQFDMEVRNERTIHQFLSSPNSRGDFVYKGACFLKVYFVRTPKDMAYKNMPPVVPFRPFSYLSGKGIFSANPKSIIDLRIKAVQLVGITYMTYGTNQPAYEFFSCFFSTICKRMGQNKDDLTWINEFLDTMRGKELNSFVEQCKVTLEEMRQGFPTWKFLQLRNEYFPEKCHLRSFFDNPVVEKVH